MLKGIHVATLISNLSELALEPESRELIRR